MGGIASAPLPDAVIDLKKLKAINATALADINGGAATVYGVEIDASANSGEDVFVKFVDSLTATPGSDDPVLQLRCTKALTQTFMFPRGLPFGTGISAWAAQEKTIAGVTNPSGTVNVTLLLGA